MGIELPTQQEQNRRLNEIVSEIVPSGGVTVTDDPMNDQLEIRVSVSYYITKRISGKQLRAADFALLEVETESTAKELRKYIKGEWRIK